MKNWVEKDLQHIWHPYTQMEDCRKLPPILIEKTRGVKLYDDKGNFYYDTISSWWCNVHGHNRPEINKAITKQLNSLAHIMFAGFTHRNAILLAERILSIVPDNLAKVFFSDDGSTAVETALKMSFQYWQNTGKRRKTKFVSLDHGYHGDTIGTMSVSGVGLFNKVFEKLFFKSFKVPSPYCYRCPMGKKRISCALECTMPLEMLLRNKSREIAALLLEPLVMAAGGMIIYPKEYLARVAQVCDKYGVHLILDEVATGFGRTGKMFACDHMKIKPDFLCLSKGITAGYLPLGLTITTDNIYKAFYAEYYKMKTFYSGHTYTANPIACSCALASLDIFKNERTLDKMNKIMPVLHDGLERFRSLPIVGDVRYIGMIGAIELVKNKKTKEGFGFRKRIGFEIYKKGLKRSLVLRPLGDIIYLFLPLCIDKADIEYILYNTYDVVRSVRVHPI